MGQRRGGPDSERGWTLARLRLRAQAFADRLDGSSEYYGDAITGETKIIISSTSFHIPSVHELIINPLLTYSFCVMIDTV